MVTARRLLFLVTVVILAAGQAAAQTLPWPTNPPGQPPWRGERWPQFCAAEFFKVRQEVEKASFAANAAGRRKVSREEMCKYITCYSVAALKWVKWAESNVETCGIPVQIVEQLKQVYNNTAETKERICAAVSSPRRPYPVLSPTFWTSCPIPG